MSGALSGPIRCRSSELVCLHEAGHAFVALTVGARVREMELYLDPPPASGRTRTEHDEQQRKLIALGGFAIERRLWDLGRLLKEDGGKLNEDEMLDHAADNASIDRIMYFGEDLRGSDGYWPKDLDLKFMITARDIGKMIPDLSTIERLGGALLTERKLYEDRVVAIYRGGS